MNVIIEKATPEDVPSVLALIKELAVYEKEPNAVEITEQTLLENGFSEAPLFHCFVARVEGNVVGMALVYFRFSTWKGKTLHLEDLIVSQDYRGNGIGQKLYHQVMEFANANKAKRVEWVVLDWNTPAIEFYKKTGVAFLKDWYLVQLDEKGLQGYLKKTDT